MPTRIKGTTHILSIHNGTAWEPVACLTSTSLSQTRNILESQTMCDPGVVIKTAGTKDYEISAEGESIDTTSVGSADLDKASHDTIKVAFETGNEVTWRLGTGLADTAYYYGNAIIAELEMSGEGDDSNATFSATLAGTGNIVTTDPA